MGSSVRLSVIIPLYNKEDSIVRTIKSVLSQSYTNFELIVVDDGSIDRGREVIQRQISDCRLRIVGQSNKGVSAARNAGISLASAEHILFLDADDQLEEDALCIFDRLITSYPDASVYTTNFHVSYDGLSARRPYCRGKIEGVVNNSFKDYWFQRIHVRTGNSVFKKVALLEAGLFDERMSYYEDQDLALRLLEIGKVVYSPEMTFVYIKKSSDLSCGPKKIVESFAYWLVLKGKGFWHKLILALTLHTTIRKVNSEMENFSELRRKYIRLFFYVGLSRIIIRLIK